MRLATFTLFGFIMIYPVSAFSQSTLWDVQEVDKGLLNIGLAHGIRENCDKIIANKLSGIFYVWKIVGYANKAGFSMKETRSFIDNRKEKEILKQETNDKFVKHYEKASSKTWNHVWLIISGVFIGLMSAYGGQMNDEQRSEIFHMDRQAVADEKQKNMLYTIGNKQDDKFMSHFHPHGDDDLKGSLKDAGFDVEDITDVLLTHFHFDHVGGAVEMDSKGNLVPTFPNATYWTNELHYYAAYEPNQREKASFLKENFLPLKEWINWVKILRISLNSLPLFQL